MVRVRVKEKRNTEPDRNSLKNMEDVKRAMNVTIQVKNSHTIRKISPSCRFSSPTSSIWYDEVVD